VTVPVRALSAAHPELTVDVVRTGWDNQVEVIRDGRADVSFVRLPVDQRGLKMLALFSEPRVAVLPIDHRLAGKESFLISDLADEHLLQDPDAVPEWRDIALEMQASGSRRPPPVMRTVEEKLEHVAAGHGIVVLPESTATFYRRPDVTHARISDIGLNQVSLAWDASRRSRVIHEFAEFASSVRES
jgi:DNA-binding transcriptional LysR family regulator